MKIAWKNPLTFIVVDEAWRLGTTIKRFSKTCCYSRVRSNMFVCWLRRAD